MASNPNKNGDGVACKDLATHGNYAKRLAHHSGVWPVARAVAVLRPVTVASRPFSMLRPNIHCAPALSQGLVAHQRQSLSWPFANTPYRAVVSFPSYYHRLMLQHTRALDLALQEADSVHQDHLLARANVSPYYSSSSIDTKHHLSSFYEFALDAEDNAIPPRLEADEAMAWEHFFKHKTPPFSSIFDTEATNHHDLAAFSPTHTDKKVLVTDHDLKVDAWDPLVLDDPEHTRPRRALLSEAPRRSRYAPYDAPGIMRLPALGGSVAPNGFPYVGPNYYNYYHHCQDDVERRAVQALPNSRHVAQGLGKDLKPSSRKASKRRIGIYTPEARRERIRRFHEKRKKRVFHKRTQYDCRQRLAQSCPRVKGRFVRKHAAVDPPQDATRDETTD